MHAATCNLLVRRDAVLAAGGFDEGLWPGEDTVLSLTWGRAGQLRFEPGAVVHHLNRTGLQAFVRHQVRLGSSFLEVCRATGFPYPFLTHRAWAPLAAGARLIGTFRLLRPSPARLRRAVRLLPLLAVGLAAWAFGFATSGRRVR